MIIYAIINPCFNFTSFFVLLKLNAHPQDRIFQHKILTFSSEPVFQSQHGTTVLDWFTSSSSLDLRLELVKWRLQTRGGGH